MTNFGVLTKKTKRMPKVNGVLKVRGVNKQNDYVHSHNITIKFIAYLTGSNLFYEVSSCNHLVDLKAAFDSLKWLISV